MTLQRQLMEVSMDVLAQRLDAKLREWKPEIAEQVRQRVTEIIESADQNVLDVMRSRAVEQEVLDLLDEPATR
jgi:ribose 1,5-bisphosphokinase PhnN